MEIQTTRREKKKRRNVGPVVPKKLSETILSLGVRFRAKGGRGERKVERKKRGEQVGFKFKKGNGKSKRNEMTIFINGGLGKQGIGQN